jgi:hypothetical protein
MFDARSLGVAARPALVGVGMGGRASPFVANRFRRAWAMAHGAHAVPARDHGLPVAQQSPVEKVVFMKGAQIGGTEAGKQLDRLRHPSRARPDAGGAADRGNGQTLVEAACGQSLIDSTPVLRERVKEARSRDSGNTVQSKRIHRRDTGHDGCEQRRWPSLHARALPLSRRGGRLRFRRGR